MKITKETFATNWIVMELMQRVLSNYDPSLDKDATQAAVIKRYCGDLNATSISINELIDTGKFRPIKFIKGSTLAAFVETISENYSEVAGEDTLAKWVLEIQTNKMLQQLIDETTQTIVSGLELVRSDFNKLRSDGESIISEVDKRIDLQLNLKPHLLNYLGVKENSVEEFSYEPMIHENIVDAMFNSIGLGEYNTRNFSVFLSKYVDLGYSTSKLKTIILPVESRVEFVSLLVESTEGATPEVASSLIDMLCEPRVIDGIIAQLKELSPFEQLKKVNGLMFSLKGLDKEIGKIAEDRNFCNLEETTNLNKLERFMELLKVTQFNLRKSVFNTIVVFENGMMNPDLKSEMDSAGITTDMLYKFRALNSNLKSILLSAVISSLETLDEQYGNHVKKAVISAESELANIRQDIVADTLAIRFKSAEMSDTFIRSFVRSTMATGVSVDEAVFSFVMNLVSQRPAVKEAYYSINTGILELAKQGLDITELNIADINNDTILKMTTSVIDKAFLA